MAEKRALDESDAPTNRDSKAARFNVRTLKKLQAAISDDSEVDLISQMPMGYSNRLIEYRTVAQPPVNRTDTITRKEAIAKEDIRDFLCASDPAEVHFPLSPAVSKLLDDVSKTAEPLPSGLSQRLYQLLKTSGILWNAAFARHKMVFRCSTDIVVKAVHKIDDYTEYTALLYLERHKPNIPAPRPLGLVSMSGVSFLFMSHMQSTSLGEIWHNLGSAQKASLSNQLNTIIVDLRSLPYSEGTPLGGVGGEGCKDIRRHLRRSETPVTSLRDFEDFMSSSSRPGGNVFLDFLRQVSPLSLKGNHVLFSRTVT